MTTQQSGEPKTLNGMLQIRLTHLEAVNRVVLRLGTKLDLQVLLREFAALALELTHYKRALILVADPQDSSLKFGAIAGELATEVANPALENIFISTYRVENEPIIKGWVQGHVALVEQEQLPSHSSLKWLAHTLHLNRFFSIPLMLGGRLIGVVLVDGCDDTETQCESDRELLKTIAPTAAIALENARQHTQLVDELAAKMRELHMSQQIDRELTDRIKLSHVFDITLDWVLRFTRGHAASLAFYDEGTDTLRFVAHYGYNVPVEQLAQLRAESDDNVAYRVARSGQAEIIPDVSMDKDYIRIAETMRSLMCAPVMREERVIAVIVVESKRLNGFTEEHLEFVKKLANRAGVAIDNARLYSDSERERKKLAQIMSNIADVIIGVDDDDRIMLLNQMAYAVLRLYTDKDYLGLSFAEVFEGSDLLPAYQQAKEVGQGVITEIHLPSNRTFHVNVSRCEGFGWIIAMHDISPLKETDRLKNELVATVSHDLKQPLSTIYGYSELLAMLMKDPDPPLANAIRMIQRSTTSMRQLIDDLLNLARIESGMQLELRPVRITDVISDCVEAIKPMAETKEMVIQTDLPQDLPLIKGEPQSLGQIFTNLVTNAVKYTPPEGNVRIWAEQRAGHLQIAVQDNGLGISPEDQAHIFERFYRVRRPETDSIDGTGLGLTIVKRLIEANKGHINLESHLGEGSTFFVTLPIFHEESA